MERDAAALDEYQLLPRLLAGVVEADSRFELLGRTLGSPILPLLHGNRPDAPPLALTSAELLQDPTAVTGGLVPLLGPGGMGELLASVKRLAALEVPAIALDLTGLAATPPYGTSEWQPRDREELAELRAAAGCPVWLYGVPSPADAETALEAGLDAVVVHAGAGRYLGGPSAIDVLPEIVDAVAGTMDVLAGGQVRSGLDVFRYLAVGADAVVVESDRSLANLEAELRYAMRLTGCATLADIGYEAIFVPLFGEY